VSLALIALASPMTAAVIFALTVFFIYPIHRATVWLSSRGAPRTAKGLLLTFGIGVLVCLFCWSKIARQTGIHPFLHNWSLAGVIGLSYFLFRAIDFLHIQAITKVDERSPAALVYYGLFPSTLTSGPIQKFLDFKQQISAPAPLTRALVLAASYRITRGYFRKIVLASTINHFVEKSLGTEHFNFFKSGLTIALLYVYFYFDFAGYSDIAIGFGSLLGVKVPENFRKPFLATTVSEFWRNWHITLVDWFRDHVFIPLGGMQVSRLRAAGLAFLIMVLCGLWHGVSLPFMAWGVWHGSVLFMEGVSGLKPVPPPKRSGLKYWWRVASTNALVAFGSIFFLPHDGDILRILKGFITLW
jgi:alginate O-acetyltransferase complex protein AlgI